MLAVMLCHVVADVFSHPPPPPLSSPIRVCIVTGPDGRPSGMGFVEFESPEAAAAAMTKHRQMMGTRYVEIFPSTEDERARFAPHYVPPPREAAPPEEAHEHA